MGQLTFRTLNNCSFNTNSAQYAGAIYNDGYVGIVTLSLTGCTFNSNSAQYAGAIFTDGGMDRPL